MRYLDPPDEYDWPWCEEFSLLIGADDIPEMWATYDRHLSEYWTKGPATRGAPPLAPCEVCPVRARCPDGVMVLTSRRADEIRNRCDGCEAWGQSCATCPDMRSLYTTARKCKPLPAEGNTGLQSEGV